MKKKNESYSFANILNIIYLSIIHIEGGREFYL